MTYDSVVTIFPIVDAEFSGLHKGIGAVLGFIYFGILSAFMSSSCGFVGEAYAAVSVVRGFPCAGGVSS